jgi:hypothetical protein
MDDRKLPAIAVEDIGKAAYTIFKRGDEFSRELNPELQNFERWLDRHKEIPIPA